MNKHDYEEIAGIINVSMDRCPCGLCRVSNRRFERLISKLVTYFEREDENKTKVGCKYKFNKQQFLKECGVK